MLFICFIFRISLTFSYIFCLENVLSTSLYYEADKCVSHTSDVEGLMIFVVRYPPEWMNISRLCLFETAMYFVHSNDH